MDGGGGECSQPCPVAQPCNTYWDCFSRVCTNGTCQSATTCTNKVKDGSETCVDGGGCRLAAGGRRQDGRLWAERAVAGRLAIAMAYHEQP